MWPYDPFGNNKIEMLRRIVFQKEYMSKNFPYLLFVTVFASQQQNCFLCLGTPFPEEANAASLEGL